MKDLIIGTSTNYDWSKLKYWVNSINASGFEGDKVLVLLNCDRETVKKVIDAGFIVVAGQKDSEGNLVHQSAIPVHVERFLFMHNFLTTRDYRYIITTDVKDVVFQHNPIEYIEKNLHEDKDLIFASESLRYIDEPWGNQNLFETYGNYIYEQYKKNEQKALLDNLLYSPNEYKNISYSGYCRNFPGTKLSEQNLLELKNIAKKELNNAYAKENVNNYEMHPKYNNFNNKSDIFNTKLFNTNIK